MTDHEMKMMEQRDLRIAGHIDDLLCSKLMWHSALDLMNESKDPIARGKACESASAWRDRYYEAQDALRSIGIPVLMGEKK